MATTSVNLSLRLAEDADTVSVADDIAGPLNTIDGKWASQSPSTLAMGASPSAGSTLRVARADHEHGGPGFGVPVGLGTSNSEGAATSVARSNHVHQAPSEYIVHGPESFDIETSLTEDMVVNFPSVPTAATLVLRGRALRAGLVAAHTHSFSATSGSNGGESLTSGGQSVDHTHSGTSGNPSADHTHSGTSGGQSIDHTHSGTSSGQSVDHTHSGTSDNQSAGHTHAVSVGSSGSHTHLLIADDNQSGTKKVQTRNDAAFGERTGYVVSSGSDHTHSATSDSQSAGHTHALTTGGASAGHTHTLTTGGASAGHTHTLTTSGASVGHSHTVTTSNHTHTVSGTSGSAGSGGFTASTRPAGVSVTIDGTDRTTALGGSFGSSGADWDENALNILSYITTSGEHTFVFGCTTGGRLKAEVRMTL